MSTCCPAGRHAISRPEITLHIEWNSTEYFRIFTCCRKCKPGGYS